MIAVTALFALLSFSSMPGAYAFDNVVHASLTQSALQFLAENPDDPDTAFWLKGSDSYQNQIQITLVSGTVEADYRPDTWLKSMFHKPVAGILKDGVPMLFTSLLHFMIPASTTWWTDRLGDGYTYRLSSHEGRDKFMDSTSLAVAGEFSASLGGSHPQFPIERHGVLGGYTDGYKGTPHDWQKMFFAGNSASEAAFPPAFILAEHAYRAFLDSERAPTSDKVCWTEDLPLASSFNGTTRYHRIYCRATVESLPKNLDLLGITLHMGQDMAIPQHVIGTLDRCHEELEDLAETLACGVVADKKALYARYDNGTYHDNPPSACLKLYDAEMVKSLKTQFEFLDPKKEMSVSDRMAMMAAETTKWKWGKEKKWLVTILPDGSTVRAKSCAGLTLHAKVGEQIKIQYNMAVAMTAGLLEQAIHSYKKTTIAQK